MRRIVFYSATIKDIGRDKDGFLYCTTTMGRLASPLPVSKPDANDQNVKFYALTPLAIAPDASGLVAELGGVSFAANPKAFFDTFDEPPMIFTGLFFARDSRRTFYAIGHRNPLSSAEVVAEQTGGARRCLLSAALPGRRSTGCAPLRRAARRPAGQG